MNFWLVLIGLTAYLAIITACVAVVLSENRNPIRALAWTLALLFLPGVGLVFYLFFGRGLKGLSMISKRNKRKLMHHSYVYQSPPMAKLQGAPHRQLIKLTHNLCNAPLTFNNSIKIYTRGSEKFEDFRRDLLSARKSIFIQYYIFAEDKLGREIAEILCQKAREGVRVGVMYDNVGSFHTSNRFFRCMQEAGVSVHPFFRVTFPQLANRINWRNHRKIVIIDDEIGYIGGMNIADRYVDGLPNGSGWRDTHFRVQGDIVQSLFYSYAIDWNFLNPHLVGGYRFTPQPHEPNNLGMQLVTSGPNDPWHALSMCFLKAIATAKKRIYIQTPYFLPTDVLLRSLEGSALAKVDVRIMIPRKPDSRMLKYASYSFITTCLSAGIKVYLYEPGMLHAKMMVIDDDLVTAGSTNFDFRSFENNFESNLLIYDPEVNRRMRDIYFEDLSHCTKINLSDWRKRPRLQRAFENVVRLLSPIL